MDDLATDIARKVSTHLSGEFQGIAKYCSEISQKNGLTTKEAFDIFIEMLGNYQLDVDDFAKRMKQ